STLATSLKVDAMCCASTARQSRRVVRLASEATACGVKVLDDTNQALRAENQLSGTSAERRVVAVEPGARRRVVGPDHRVQRAEQPDEPGPELPLLLLIVQCIGAVRHPRHGGGAEPQYVGKARLRDF